MRNDLFEKILLEVNNGRLRRGIKFKIFHLYTNSIEKMWDKILNIEMLEYLSRPMANISMIKESLPKSWETNKEYVFKVFIKVFFRWFIPIREHKVIFEKINKNERVIILKEQNNIVKIMNHKMSLVKKTEMVTGGIEEVEIYAGIFTLFVAIWIRKFYKYRRDKLREIAIFL
ncbi:hypothetical protein [Treponema sp. R8-4-B8]